MTGSVQPQICSHPITAQTFQESARQSGCFLLVMFMYIYISNQKQPSCKKRCGPQKGHGEKDVKSRWRPRNGCDGRLMVTF